MKMLLPVCCASCCVEQLWAQSRAFLCLWVLVGPACTMSVHTQTRTWPLLLFLPVGSTPRAAVSSRTLLQFVGDGLFALLLLWGLCDSSWRAAFAGTALCLGPAAEGWGSRNRACWASGAFNALHWGVQPLGHSDGHTWVTPPAPELPLAQGCAGALACELVSDGILWAVGYSQGQTPLWQTTWLTGSVPWVPHPRWWSELVKPPVLGETPALCWVQKQHRDLSSAFCSVQWRLSGLYTWLKMGCIMSIEIWQKTALVFQLVPRSEGLGVAGLNYWSEQIRHS